MIWAFLIVKYFGSSFMGIIRFRILCILALVADGKAFSFFAGKIPNGENVPHPCKPNYLWKGVGHMSKDGGGSRNQFGVDFFNNGKVSTTYVPIVVTSE